MEVLIRKSLVEDMIDFAKENHPYVVRSLLGGSFKKDSVIAESIILQGFDRSDDFGDLLTGHTQVTSDTIGVFVTHPEAIERPEKEDLLLATKNNGMLITMDYPYEEKDIRVFNPQGKEFEWKKP